MGAAWVLSGKTIPLFVEPINYDSVGLLQEVKQVEKLLDGKSLDRIKDELQTILEIPSIQIKSDRWSDKKDSFLKKTKEYIRSNPFGNPVTKEQIEYLDDQVNNLNTENQKLNIELTTLSEENKKLIKLNNGLKNALKPEDIVKIETNLLGLKSMGEFDYLCAKVKEALSKIDGSIQDLIFVEYSGKKLGVSFYNNESVLYEARARDFLAVDSLSINWNDTKTMRQIRSSLDDLKAFIEENKNDKDFSFAYDSRFENPLSLSNLGFWEEVLGIPNYFV
jgi:hypothetical protein